LDIHSRVEEVGDVTGGGGIDAITDCVLNRRVGALFVC
jgi:hypothetical protein